MIKKYLTKNNVLIPIREIRLDINKPIFKNNPFSKNENEVKAIERRKILKLNKGAINAKNNVRKISR